MNFPQKFDEPFEKLISNPDVVIPDEFTTGGAENLLAALYQCEALEQKYIQWGIDLTILDATISDVKHWINTWYELSGELGLQETGWLGNHFSGKLFKLGRLQFCMGYAMQDILWKNIEQGAPIIEVHIPSGESLDYEACKESIRSAKIFFEKYFPEFTYQCFTCHSWLLDKTLVKFLEKDSNILAFQKLYDVISAEESDALLKYIFRWDTTREKLEEYTAKSNLAEQVKAYAISGGKFYVPYGVVDESRI